MDNYIFRSALNGFNRQDVTAYIEKAQKESADRIAELETQLEELRKSEDALRSALEERAQECDDLREQMNVMVRDHEQSKSELEAQLLEMRGEVATAHSEKENVAQLELEARKRAEELLDETCVQTEELLEQARSQAQALVTAANEQAEDIISKADQRAKEIRADMESHAHDVEAQVNEIASSVETIVSHMSAELRKMDVAVSQLPINFNHLKDGMREVLKLTAEQSITEK